MAQRFNDRGYARPPPLSNRYEHSDRWNRSLQRSRSPVRDRRDSRDFGPPRDIHLDRAPRFHRDGPPSAGPNTPNQPRFPSSGYGRGRGRPADWDMRGRPRYQEERDTFRRSPSRGPRRERQGSVDSRDYDRRDDRRDDYRDRHDDDWRFRRRDDFVRRDPPPRIDTRHPSDARSDSIPSPIDRSGRPPSPHRRPSPVDRREHDISRRASMMDHSNKDGRRESGRSDPGRPPRERSPDTAPVRAAEETSSVAVPQFGFIPPILPTTPAKTSASPLPPPKTIPTAPRALLSNNIPTGPKAERIPEPSPIVNKETHQSPVEEQVHQELPPQAPISVNVSPALPQHPLPTRQESPSLTRVQSLELSVSPRVQQLAPPTAPIGPRGSAQPSRASSAGPPTRDFPPSIPVHSPVPKFGQRPSMTPLTQLPQGLPENIPTGPRAMSRVPPLAPRNHRPQVTSLQWRPNLPNPPLGPRAPSLPIKRDANGMEKEKTPVPERSPEPIRVNTIDLETKRSLEGPAQALAPLPNRLEGQNEDTKMTDVPNPSPTSPVQGLGYFSSDDDEGQGLDEEDFAEQAENYRRKKAELEAQFETLDRRHRAGTPLLELDKGNAILAILDEMALRPSPEPPIAPPMIDIAMTEDVTATKSPTPEEIQTSAVPTQAPQEEAIPTVARELTPEMSKSPDFEYLPYLPERPPTPVSDPDHLELSGDEDLKDILQSKLLEINEDNKAQQEDLKDEYLHRYLSWKHSAMLLDKQREATEVTETQTIVPVEVPEPIVEQIALPLPTPNESRRLHKYSSELDLERALEESRREEEERRLKAEKEKKEALAHVEREAEIPALLNPHEMDLRIFQDTSLQRIPTEALRTFEFEPPVDNFTPEQSREFTRLWRGQPKMWHKIADDLGISTKDCIYHYYATKWDKPYKGGKARRPKKPAASRRGAMFGGRTKVDADNDSTDAATGLTETGRPRRAAAPTFSKPTIGKGDTELDVEGTAPVGRRTAGKVDNGNADGKGARGKSAKEKPARKPRNPPLAAKTLAASSPQKSVKEKKEKTASAMPALIGGAEEWVPKSENVPPQDRLMPGLIPQHHQQLQQFQQQHLQQQSAYIPEPIAAPVYRVDNPNLVPMDPSGSPAAARPRSHSNTLKHNASSYWSVIEESEFQTCLAYYGTDFTTISQHINKKTPVMIKNHFQKYRADEEKYRHVLEAAEAADQRRQRGEPLGEMPTVLRKTYQFVPGALRTLMPSEPMDLDSPPSMKNMNVIHGSPSFSARPIFPQGHNPHSTPPSQDAVPTHGPVPSVALPPALKQPRMGFFADTSPIRPQGQTQTQSQQPHMSPPALLMQEPVRGPKPVSRIKSEHDPHRTAHQPIGRDRSNTGNALTAAQLHQDIPAGLAAYPTGISMNSGGGANIRLVAQTYNLQDQAFGGKDLLPVAPAPSRGVIDLTASSGGFEQSQPHRPQSPAIRDFSGSRFHQQNVTPPAPPKSNPPPAAEPPPRRVNIMSMLNPEPAEEKSRKEPDPPSRSSHTPSEHMGMQRDPYGRDSMHRPSYSIHDRPMTSAPEPPVSAPSHRDPGWPSSRSYAPAYSHNDSPRLAPQPNAVADYRHSALSQLNHHTSRVVPSPPPGGPYHSRTSSYSTGHPHQHQQHQSNPSSQSGTPTEAYSRSSLRGGQSYTPGPPLAPAQSQHGQHSRDVSYSANQPPQPYSDRRDPHDPQNSAYAPGPPLRAFRNTAPHDYDPRDGPPPPHSLFSSGHGNAPSPQPPSDGRYAPPMGYDRSRGGDERDRMYAEDMRRREEELRNGGTGSLGHRRY